MPLARDIARRLPDGFLIVSVDKLPVEGLGGVVWHKRGKGAVIMIDPEQVLDLGSTVERCFAHELSHLLDPGPFNAIRLKDWSTSRAKSMAHNRIERFANTLGPMLLEAMPRSVPAAKPLIRRAWALTITGRGPKRVSDVAVPAWQWELAVHAAESGLLRR